MIHPIRHVAAVLVVLLLPLGCGGPGFTHLKKGALMSMSGEIDNIIRTELPYDKEMLSVTSVGFTSGQGISLIGVQPGLNKGKRIKIQGEFFQNIRGTDVFKVTQISAEPGGGGSKEKD
ncbi:MAG: hypothetical protein HY207_11120 [Nitrospirae bacterium]|nr:hypothetical protein [Nitrospirota bacterium]